MRSILETILVAGLVVACQDRTHRKDELFASWREAQSGVKSLVVQFAIETWDPIFEEKQKADGTFRLLRTAKDEVLASYEVKQEQAKSHETERWSGLLNSGTAYLLMHDRKAAIRFQPNNGDLRGFLERFNPFTVLHDQKRALEKCQIEIVKQDEWYTYLTVKPRHGQRPTWFWFDEGLAVVLNKASEAVPKDMPSQLRYTDGIRQYTFEIKQWRQNGNQEPKLEEFTKPEDRPGWEVHDWPFRAAGR